MILKNSSVRPLRVTQAISSCRALWSFMEAKSLFTSETTRAYRWSKSSYPWIMRRCTRPSRHLFRTRFPSRIGKFKPFWNSSKNKPWRTSNWSRWVNLIFKRLPGALTALKVKNQTISPLASISMDKIRIPLQEVISSIRIIQSSAMAENQTKR